MTTAKDDKRRLLKAAGWIRHDRHTGEWWQPPWDGIGYAPTLITLESAWRKYKKYYTVEANEKV